MLKAHGGLPVNGRQARRFSSYAPRARRLDRDSVIANVVRIAISTSPSPAVARKTIEDWPGHPKDPDMRADALALLDQIKETA